MDAIDRYRDIIESCLLEYTKPPYVHDEIDKEAVFDRSRDRYIVTTIGWDKRKRIHSCLLHIDLIDGKVWIQRDDTESGIAYDLLRAGIPKEDLVIGFRPADVRPFIEFANAG
ncbi:MAG: XisI protein [Planctomycetaceae bacterium]